MLQKMDKLLNEPGQLVVVSWYRSARTLDLRLLRVPVTVFCCSSAAVAPGESHSVVSWRFFKGSRSRDGDNTPDSDWLVGAVEVNASESDPLPSIAKLLNFDPASVSIEKWVHAGAQVVREKVICSVFECDDEWTADAMHLGIDATNADKSEAIRKLKLAVREQLLSQGRTEEAALSDEELFEWID